MQIPEDVLLREVSQPDEKLIFLPLTSCADGLVIEQLFYRPDMKRSRGY